MLLPKLALGKRPHASESTDSNEEATALHAPLAMSFTWKIGI